MFYNLSYISIAINMIFLVVILLVSLVRMPGPHPRYRRAPGVLDGMRNVWDWVPLGWHWEMVSGVRRLERNPGLVVDPDLLWWRSRGPQSVRREPASEEVVHRRIREEDDHVRRYMAALDVGYYSLWQVLPGSHPSYKWVIVPSLWVSTASRSRRRLLF